MKEKPRQVLSLLPGEYYHPEAEYKETTYPDGTKTRGHNLHRKKHGLWEEYYSNGTLWERYHCLHGKLHGLWEEYLEDGTLKWRRHYLHRKKHGIWEWYRSDGIPEKLKCYSEGNQVPFFIESLLGISILDI